MNRCHFIITRRYSKKFSATLNLPNTKFPLSMKDGKTFQKEKELRKVCNFDGLYEWQQSQERENIFILHDGPPYANGKTHVGHALNKILKDITNRYKLLNGFKVSYVPGWDCHGTPIEQKVLAELREDHRNMNPLDIRVKAKKFAQKAIAEQLKSFKAWGVMADWNKQCYYTFDKDFEVNQLEVFYNIYDKGLIYQDYMPVFWSPSSSTALAEAELEYNQNHVSTSVYVKFPLTKIPSCVKQYSGDKGVFALIWTTTPWTLAVNEAVAVGNTIKYCLVKSGKSDDLYIVCTEFVEKLSSMLNDKIEVLAVFAGSELLEATYSIPRLNKQGESPIVAGHHVSTSKGTGLVHTAPPHGPEDFQIALANQLPMECHVDENGCYTESLGSPLTGKSVITEGNQLVLEMLSSDVILQHDYTHSYPYDWRSKKPVIYRASKQWFVNTSAIKEQAIASLKSVKVYPSGTENSMLAWLNARTYWCISRQRAWGVPIPVFYHRHTGDILLNRHSIDHVKSLVAEHGTDCWWTLSIDQLLPPEVKVKSNYTADDEFVKGKDVLDIWFDSGTTWATVLKDSDYCSDVYLEGIDQFGGWFQSSLLTSIAMNQKPPYRSLVVHGFATDEDGRKMSKSLGNVIDPQTVISGGKDKKREPAYGADVLRLWAAHAGLDQKVNIGPSLLHNHHQLLFKFRKSLRYLLSNLYDYDLDESCVEYEELLPTDKYVLHHLHDLLHKVEAAYGEYKFTRVIQLCEKFSNVYISAFHAHVTKDRMYCSPGDSLERQSGQTTQYYMLTAMLKCLAPIVPHLCEEIYQHYPSQLKMTDSVFKTRWLSADPEWQDPTLSQTVELAFSIRDSFYRAIGTEDPIGFDLAICAKPKLFEQIKKLQDAELTSNFSPLCEILQCSTVSVLSRPPVIIPDESQLEEGICTLTLPDGSEEQMKYMLVILPAEDHICERCRRYTTQKYGQPCERCLNVMAVGWQ